MTVVSFEKLKGKKETYLCTLLNSYVMPATYHTGKKIHELIVPRQFPMTFFARSRLILFDEKQTPIENAQESLVGELYKSTYLWMVIGIDEKMGCYDTTATHWFGLFNPFVRGASAIRLTRYNEAIVLWQNRKKVLLSPNWHFFSLHFTSYRKEGLSLCEDSIRLEKSQLSLLKTTDRITAVREYHRLLILVTSIWLFTSFIFQKEDAKILWLGLGISCITWHLFREAAKEFEGCAQMMLEGFKKRKAMITKELRNAC